MLQMLHPEATGVRLDKWPLSASLELGLREAVPAKSTEPPYTKRLADILDGFLEGWLAQAWQEHVCSIMRNGGIAWHMVGFSAEHWHQRKSPAQPQSEGLQHHHFHPHSPQCWNRLWSLVSTTFEVPSIIKPLMDLIHSYSKCPLICTPILKHSFAAEEVLLGKG